MLNIKFLNKIICGGALTVMPKLADDSIDIVLTDPPYFLDKDANFSIRDCFLWIYTQNQVKAMGLNHFIDKMKISETTKKKIKEKLASWKTPG